MRARSFAPHETRPAREWLPASPAALVFLRGRDADARLRELAGARRAVRPLLGTLAVSLVGGRTYEKLGYRSLGDYGRERLGVGARTLREWARVWRALEELPRLRRALLSGEISWGVARLVVGLAMPETEAACLEAVRGRTLRAVRAIVAAVREAEATAPEEPEAEDERVRVRLRCSPRVAGLWAVAVELARRVAGEALPLAECAERIAAEAVAALGREETPREVPLPPSKEKREDAGSSEHGLREEAFPGLRWAEAPAELPPELAALGQGLPDCPPRELDRRLRAAIAFLQRLDLETGRILRQMADRGLFAELGFPNLARYAEERLDGSARTARRLVALARSEHRAPAVAVAFRGRIHRLQAEALARVADVASARAWVARARAVTLRRLEDELAFRPAAAIAFRAPPEVAAFFLEMVRRAGSLERLLAYAIATWAREGERFRDYADFTRDGFRCTVPGCTARRNLQSHHIRFRSAGGPDEAWNRTTLCAYHHERGVHREGSVRIGGRAPEGLRFALGPEPAERFLAGDRRL